MRSDRSGGELRRRLLWATPSSLLTHPELRVMLQLEYQCGSSQGSWPGTPLFPIEFTVISKAPGWISTISFFSTPHSILSYRDDLRTTRLTQPIRIYPDTTSQSQCSCYTVRCANWNERSCQRASVSLLLLTRAGVIWPVRTSGSVAIR